MVLDRLVDAHRLHAHPDGKADAEQHEHPEEVVLDSALPGHDGAGEVDGDHPAVKPDRIGIDLLAHHDP